MCLSGEPGDTNLKVAMGRVYTTAPSPELKTWPLADLLEEIRADSLPGPVRDVTAEVTRRFGVLRAALAGLVGEDDVETLKQMAAFTEMHAPAGTDKAAMLTALAVLVEVRP